jgi:DNA-binding NarL/FixJ family response regulator
MSLVRVLVVDDFEPWRRMVCHLLENEPDLLVVRLVSDGLEAVQQARELQPDLIILDVGLPGLNGIEAARRIHELCSTSRILFLTQNSDPGVVRAAFLAGACGYVLKTDALQELLVAARAVGAGIRFVSSGLLHKGSTFAGPKE